MQVQSDTDGCEVLMEERRQRSWYVGRALIFQERAVRIIAIVQNNLIFGEQRLCGLGADLAIGCKELQLRRITLVEIIEPRILLRSRANEDLTALASSCSGTLTAYLARDQE